MEKLIKKVEKWSIERGLNTADPNKQRFKLWEEFGGLNAAIARDNRDGVIDAIGEYALKNDEFYLMVDEVVEDDNKELTVINNVDLFKNK